MTEVCIIVVVCMHLLCVGHMTMREKKDLFLKFSMSILVNKSGIRSAQMLSKNSNTAV